MSPTSTACGRTSRRRSGSTRSIRSRRGGQHLEVLAARAAALDEARFDSLQFEGPGTDLTIGLIPGAKWVDGRDAQPRRPAARRQPADRGGLQLS